MVQKRLLYKKIHIYFSLIFILVSFLSLLYGGLVFDLESGSRAEGTVIRGEDQPSTTSVYQAMYKEDLFLKIILPQEFFISEIIFNKNYLTSQKVKLRRQRRIYYVYIPEKNVFRGENQLSLKFQKPLDIESSVDLRFSNYITKKSDAIAIFSPTGQIFNNKKHGLFFSFVLLFFISVFLMLVFKFYLMVSLEAILKHAIFICIYNNIILGGLFYFSILFGYRTAISEYLYFNLHSIGALLCLSPIAIKWVGAAICRKA